MQFQKGCACIYIEEQGKRIAEITFPIVKGHPCINHTYVDDTLRGQGIASQLVERAVKELVEEKQSFYVTCDYAVLWLQKHPEYHTVWMQEEL